MVVVLLQCLLRQFEVRVIPPPPFAGQIPALM